MATIPVTALSSWAYCPRQFYLNYVLKKKEPPNAQMALGLIKHRLYEEMISKEQAIMMSIQEKNAQELIITAFEQMLRTIIMRHKGLLNNVGLTPEEAFRQAVKLARTEAEEVAARTDKLLAEGLSGERLWNAITPKIKSEKALECPKIGLNGRIDKLECYPDKLVPVELKSGKAPEKGAWEGHKLQVAAYALMLEEHYNTCVQEAIVHYIDHQTKRQIIMNPFLREKVIMTTDAVKKCIESKETPKGCGRENCTACIFVQKQLQNSLNTDRNL